MKFYRRVWEERTKEGFGGHLDARLCDSGFAPLPPNIDDNLSSSDVIVREGANVTLNCHASGSPPPSVRWKRDDGNKIAINKSLTVSEYEGEVLELTRISRLDMGAYLCIASNGVPPTVSKRIKVSVDCKLSKLHIYFNLKLLSVIFTVGLLYRGTNSTRRIQAAIFLTMMIYTVSSLSRVVSTTL
ncbi:hypothetical protein J437_LFUL009728 [Ladona fulva]|uniref:Ig-like domain-containing protein n=1 Tax=Ladona fulva TaxID=123851 RepID=A0A8K0K7U8_LADFU|nr:hypothetical protein J437_LFUL009728 [Ladona fulva]